MPDLSTSIAGIKLRSPIGISSISPKNWFYPAGPLDKFVDWHKRLVDDGAGYVVTGSMGWPDKPKPKSQWHWLGAFQKAAPDGFWSNAGENTLADMDEGLTIIEAFRNAFPADVPVIASVVQATSDPEGYARNCKRIESAGADMIELNAGCPLKLGAKAPGTPTVEGEEYGLMLGVAPVLVEPIIKAITEAVKIPVGIKLTPMAGFPGLLNTASCAIKAGAKYLVTAHLTLGLPPPDIYNGGRSTWPLKEFMGNYISSNIGGQVNRNQAYFYTALASAFFPNVDKFGGGGVMTGEHAIQLIMLGAKAVYVCTSVLMGGRRSFKRMLNFISSYMDRYGYKTIEDFSNLGLRHIRGFQDDAKVLEGLKLVSATDESKCNGCEICCDTLCPARYMKKGIAKVREGDCSLCQLCAVLCPEQAVYFATSRLSLRERLKMRPW